MHYRLVSRVLQAKGFVTFLWSFFHFPESWGVFTVSEKNSGNGTAEVIKRQSLCSLLQLTHHPCWSNKDFLISFLPHLWPTWPGLLSPKSLLHPHQIPSSNGEGAFCDTVGEDSNFLCRRRKWTHPFCSSGGWCSGLGEAPGRSMNTHLNFLFQWLSICWWVHPQHPTACRELGESQNQRITDW